MSSLGRLFIDVSVAAPQQVVGELEEDARVFTREQWAERRPNTATEWHDEGFALTSKAFHELGGDEPAAPKRRLDLSPVAFGLLLAFLLMELLLLLLVWRRKGAVSV